MSRSARRDEIDRRIQAVAHPFGTCIVLDCDQPSAAKARLGLNHAYCRRHAEHYRRHGSYSKPSYRANELRPYRSAALQWLRANQDQSCVREAKEGVRTLYLRGGSPEESFRLTGRPPAERASKIWARLRAKQIDPMIPLAIWIAVQLRHQDDAMPERKVRYRLIQAAKGVHRLAGGSHKRWEQHDQHGRLVATELHKYPASRGLVLWHLGAELARVARPMESWLSSVRSHLQST